MRKFREGDSEMLRLLIRHGANLDAAKSDGLTPLMTAAYSGQLESVKILVEAGANPNSVHDLDPSKPFTALDLAILGGHARIAAYLNSRDAVKMSRSPL